jgi:hypothetical protein
VTPKLKATRFAGLQPDELFSIREHNRRLVRRLVVVDDQSGDANMLALPLGPTSPTLSGPRLFQLMQSTVVSFDTEFVLQLPTTPDGWKYHSPPADFLCLLLVIEEKLYFRAREQRRAVAGTFVLSTSPMSGLSRHRIRVEVAAGTADDARRRRDCRCAADRLVQRLPASGRARSY